MTGRHSPAREAKGELTIHAEEKACTKAWLLQPPGCLQEVAVDLLWWQTGVSVEECRADIRSQRGTIMKGFMR